MKGPKPCWPDDDRYADVKHRLSLLLGHTRRGPLKQQVPEGLTRVETMVLIVLDDMLADGKQVHPGMLAHATHATPSALSQTLKALEQKGLIERTRGGCGDCRAVSVLLTETGKLTVAEAQRLHNESITALLDYLGEEDVAELMRILERISSFRDAGGAGEAGA